MTVTIQQGLTAASGASMTLLGTLTTTSGTTQSLTDIAAGYRQLYCELDGVSPNDNGGATLRISLSSTNGGAYGASVTISGSSSAAADTVDGCVIVYDISTTLVGKQVQPYTSLTAAALFATAIRAVTNTAAVLDAIKFTWVGGSSFDAGSIRVYGVK